MCFDLVVQPLRFSSFLEHHRTLPILPTKEPAASDFPSLIPQRWASGATAEYALHHSAHLGDYINKMNPRLQENKDQVAEEICLDNSRWFQEELTSRGMLSREGGGEELGMRQEFVQLLQVEDEHRNSTGCRIHHFDCERGTSKAAAIVASLKACAMEKDLEKGSKLHADIVKRHLHEGNLYIGSALVSMYAKCGALEKAQKVFDGFRDQNVVLWNALIAGYVQHGQGHLALRCFEQMRAAGFAPDRVTLSCILRACGCLGALEKGQQLHSQIAGDHLLEGDALVGTALVDMYAKCGALEKAQEVFDELKVRNVICWTALIAGYAQQGHGEDALSCFEQMQRAGLSPNAVTFACVLKACGLVGALEKGQEIHARIVEEHLMDKHIVVANAVVDMYAKCGALEKAQDVFDKLCVRDVISWNTLITGYAQQGFNEDALLCFDSMILGGFLPDVVTYASILKACGSLGAFEKGQDVHGQLIRQFSLQNNTVIANALIDMYVKCGALWKAQELIYELQTRDVVSWTALIAGYVQYGLGDEALCSYNQMQSEGLFPDAITFSCIIKACSNIVAANKGQEVHANIICLGSLENVMVVSTALVDMYANCGFLAEAQELFNNLSTQDIASWTALMFGYSQIGKHGIVFHLLERMIEEGTKPDRLTFTVILNTCSHEGCLDKGEIYFQVISKRFGIFYDADHYTCLIDLYSRAGQLYKAVAVIKEMPHSVDLKMWVALLSGCRKWGNVKLGHWVFEHAVRLDELDHKAYVCLSNIYGANGKHANASRLKAMRLGMLGWNESEYHW